MSSLDCKAGEAKHLLPDTEISEQKMQTASAQLGKAGAALVRCWHIPPQRICQGHESWNICYGIANI